MSNFDPTTNRVPFGLLTPEEQKTLKAWPHGWEFHLLGADWSRVEGPSWDNGIVYRGKPAPIVHHAYINVYKSGSTGLPYSNFSQALENGGEGRIATIRVDTVNNKVSVTVLD